MKKFLLNTVIAGLVAGLGAVAPAAAAEAPVTVTPPGGTDVSQAILPDPGLYGAFVGLPSARNTNFYDNNGRVVPDDVTFKFRGKLGVFAFLYVYPVEVFGGRIGSDIAIPFGSNGYSFGGVKGRTSTGLQDIYIDALYWTKNLGLAGVTPGPLPLPYGLNIGVGFAVKAPSGEFYADRLVSTGSNTWTFIPNVAVTYVTGPNWSLGDSTEISARFSFGVSTKNPLTKYQTGDIFNVDWSTTQRFGLFRIGVAGVYQEQVSNDILPTGGSPANGGRYSLAQIGPIAEYVFPDTGIFIKAKYYFPIAQKSFMNLSAGTIMVGMKF